MAVRAPATLAAAQRLCERFAALDGEIAAIEEARDVAIAKANAMVDADLAPLLKERAAIAARLAPWWDRAKAELTRGKRKSIELGGCVVGTRAGAGRVTFTGAAEAVVEALRQTAWGRKFVRTKYELDKAKLAEAMRGVGRAALETEGIGYEQDPDTFFIKRTAQSGTQAKTGR